LRVAIIAPPQARPAESYGEGVERAQAVMASDDDRIAPNARTALLEHGERRPWSVVLFHGLTNHPGQYVEFAPQLFKLGANVYVPRMKYHGYKNRLAKDIAALTAEGIIAAAYDAADIAHGLGERVAVLGISMGGLQCAYLGQFREDLSTSVPVAPDFGILQLPFGVTNTIGWLLTHAPNLFLWWDPRIREAQRPRTAYPWFSTHALAQTFRVADSVMDAARKERAKARRITTVLNRADPAVNNEVTHELVREWRGLRRDGIGYYDFTTLPENHDIIDPDNPKAATGIVYPKLIELLQI
jgi:esterase/lipase